MRQFGRVEIPQAAFLAALKTGKTSLRSGAAFASERGFDMVRNAGQMAERFKAHAWKACVRESVPWVRIPLCPPTHFASNLIVHNNELSRATLPTVPHPLLSQPNLDVIPLQVVDAVRVILTYLLTKPWVIGLVTWLGVPAFIIAIWQIKKVKDAAEATNRAVQAFKLIVREHDITYGYQQALSSLSGAMHSVTGRNYEAAALQLDFVATVLVANREIEDGVHNAAIGDIIFRVRSEREAVGSFDVGSELTGRAASSPKRLRVIRIDVEQHLARSRLKFVKEDRSERD